MSRTIYEDLETVNNHYTAWIMFAHTTGPNCAEVPGELQPGGMSGAPGEATYLRLEMTSPWQQPWRTWSLDSASSQVHRRSGSRQETLGCFLEIHVSGVGGMIFNFHKYHIIPPLTSKICDLNLPSYRMEVVSPVPSNTHVPRFRPQSLSTWKFHGMIHCY